MNIGSLKYAIPIFLLVASQYCASVQNAWDFSQDTLSVMGSDIAELSTELKNLREKAQLLERHQETAAAGLSEQQEHDLTSETGRLYKVMDQLMAKIDKGTPLHLLTEVYGKPDAVLRRPEDAGRGGAVGLESLMPGPVIPKAEPSVAQEDTTTVLAYKWRGWHDYAWFKVDQPGSGEPVIIDRGWYKLGE